MCSMASPPRENPCIALNIQTQAGTSQRSGVNCGTEHPADLLTQQLRLLDLRISVALTHKLPARLGLLNNGADKISALGLLKQFK